MSDPRGQCWKQSPLSTTLPCDDDNVMLRQKMAGNQRLSVKVDFLYQKTQNKGLERRETIKTQWMIV